MDASDLLQRAGGNLPCLDGRNRAGAGGTSAHRPLHRPAVRHSQRTDLATLYGGVTFLRRSRVARFSGRHATAVMAGRQRPPYTTWLAHLYTASSAVLALLATIAIFEYRFRDAFFWLAATIVVDSSDGVLARAVRVRECLPWFNGAKLDDIVDYLTYVFVPALFVWRSLLVPAAWTIPVASAMLLSSAYGFNREDAKTSDHFFTGFPSYWNIVVFYLFVMHASQTVSYTHLRAH